VIFQISKSAFGNIDNNTVAVQDLNLGGVDFVNREGGGEKIIESVDGCSKVIYNVFFHISIKTRLKTNRKRRKKVPLEGGCAGCVPLVPLV